MITAPGFNAADNLRLLSRNSSLPDNASGTVSATAAARRELTTTAVVDQQRTELQQSRQLDNPAASTELPGDSVRVSSTIGKAASSGMLTRDEAVAIYQKIAGML